VPKIREKGAVGTRRGPVRIQGWVGAMVNRCRRFPEGCVGSPQNSDTNACPWSSTAIPNWVYYRKRAGRPRG